jgi:phosphopantothenoylcysteine decarboxylase/phosphopantothenate--cysteine ligase
MNRKSNTVLLGVTGSVAAYKAAGIASTLVQSGADVHVLMTASAARLVGPPTFQALTGNPVVREMFHDAPAGRAMPHIDLPSRADLLLIAPATANILGKIANGIADDVLSTSALSTAAPVLVAPAMNHRMWKHPAVQANVKTLEARGVEIIGPESGFLACGEEGEGRMADPDSIAKRALEILDLG